MPVDIGPKIGIDGEAQFTRSLKNIIQQSKELQSEMKRVASEFDDADESQEKLDAQMRILNRQIENQQDRVDVLGDRYKQASRRADDLKDELARVVKEFGDTSREAQQAANALDRQETAASKAKTEYNNARTALNKLNRELDDVQDTANRAARGLDDVDSGMRDATSSTFDFGDALNANVIGDAIIDGIENLISMIGELGAQMINTAADIKAETSQFDQTFGDMGDEAQAAIAQVASESGILDTRLNQLASRIYAFARASGATPEEALSLMAQSLQVAADSAAYYDTSLEEAGETLQSFLKGNYENDSALGLSATEATRDAAAMEQFGEKFNDLSEIQKQQVLLQMVQDAQELSGAMGQASRESDGWANVTGNLSEVWRQFSGQIAMPFLENITPLIQNATAALQDLFNGIDWDYYNQIITSIFDTMQQAVETIKTDVALIWQEIEPLYDWWYQNIYPMQQDMLHSFVEWFAGVNTDNAEDWFHFYDEAKKRVDLIVTTLQEFWSTVQPYVQPMLDWLNSTVLPTIQGALDSIGQGLDNFEDWWIDSFFNAFDQSYQAGYAFTENIYNLIQNVKAFFTDLVNNVKSAVDQIVAFFQGIADQLSSWASSAYDWGSDLISGFVDGINSGIKWVEDAVSGIADTISSWLHFSRPDVGPLRYYEQWMPDMMSTMARQIDDNIGLVTAALSHMTDQMAITMPAAQPMSAARVAATQTSGPAPIIDLTVNGAPGQDVNALADIVMQKIQAATARKGAVWG